MLVHAVYKTLNASINPASSGLVHFLAVQALQHLRPPLFERVKHFWQLVAL